MRSILETCRRCCCSAATPAPVEAPTGFDNLSNGLTDDQTHANDKDLLDEVEEITPNGLDRSQRQSCRECHQNPVSGAASQVSELRVGSVHNVDLMIRRCSSITAKTRSPGDRNADQRSRHLSRGAGARAGRQPDPHVPAQPKPPRRWFRGGDPRPGADRPGARTAAWRSACRCSRRLAPARSANSAGRISRPRCSRFRPMPTSTEYGDHQPAVADRGDDGVQPDQRITEPNSREDAGGVADIDSFARFIRATKAPPRDAILAGTPLAQRGSVLFDQIGCSECHVRTFTTAPAGTSINGGTVVVSDAIGGKTFHPFSDFLLHDVGTGDGYCDSGAGALRRPGRLRYPTAWT